MERVVRKNLACLYLLVTLLSASAVAQTVTIPDGRTTPACNACRELMKAKPKEVLFGIEVKDNGHVYFTMSNKDWFFKLFTAANDGVAVDLVLKEQYLCSSPALSNAHLPKGRFLKPMYLADMKARMQVTRNGHISVDLGEIVPPALRNRECDGNMAIVKNGVICFYANFASIDRSLWELLPMGLYADTLVQRETPVKGAVAGPYYTRKTQITIPFLKNKTTFNDEDLKPLRDSLRLKGYHIKRMDIRAYSSVEGSTELNKALQEKRAASIITGLQRLQPGIIESHITTSENWVEFYRDIAGTAFDSLGEYDEEGVKELLMEKKNLTAKMEPVLKKHRKAVVDVYLDKNSGFETTSDTGLVTRFHSAVVRKDLDHAAMIQREVFERINGGRLPNEFMNRLEVPEEKEYLDLLVNNETYIHELGLKNDIQTLRSYQKLLAMDPNSTRARYNACALALGAWKNIEGFVNPDSLLHELQQLSMYKIPASLIKRMLVNYHIILSEVCMKKYAYDKKDSAVAFVVNNYIALHLNDNELLSLGKYLCYYGQFTQAQQILEKRATQINVNEDLLFYYLTLKLFDVASYDTDEFDKLVLNAVTINRKRFCQIFSSTIKGGAGFQLLDHATLKELHCSYCQP